MMPKKEFKIMKTLKLFKQYKRLLEQDQVEEVGEVEQVGVAADATNVADIPEEEAGITAQGEVYIAELLTNAFIYPPKRSDVNTAAQALKHFGQTEPRKVIEAIETLLQLSDQSVSQDLPSIDEK